MDRNGVSATGIGQEPPTPSRAGVGRALRRLAAGTRTVDGGESWDAADQVEATPISDCRDRDWVNITGRLRSVTLRPHGAGQTLEADLWDGTGEVTLVWYGRDEIHGVKPGRRLNVQGRLCCPGGRPTIFNPRYELRSPPGT